MTRQIVTAVASLMLGACATSAPEPITSGEASAAVSAKAQPATAVAASSAPAAEAEGEEKVICRKEIITGSRFKREVCRTVSALNDRAEEDKAALRQMRAIRSGSQNDTNGIRSVGN